MRTSVTTTDTETRVSFCPENDADRIVLATLRRRFEQTIEWEDGAPRGCQCVCSCEDCATLRFIE